MWGTLPAEQVVRRLGLWRFPSRSTRWSIVRGLDTGILEEALRLWLPNDPVDAADGNVRRGSKRAGQLALAVLTLVGQTVGQVLAQRAVEGGNELAAASALLEEVPLEGRVVSADAVILKAPLVQKVVKKGGLHRAGERHPTGTAEGVGGVDRRPVSAQRGWGDALGRSGQGARTDGAAGRVDGAL